MRTLLLAAVFCAVTWAQATVEKKSFTGAREVVVDNVNGPLEIVGYEGSTVELEAHREVRASSYEERARADKEVKLTAEQEGAKVRIYIDGPFRCNCQDGWRGWRRSDYSVKYRLVVRVPAGVKLDARTVNGPITAKYSRAPSGDVILETVNGGVDTTFPAGFGADVHTKTMNGSVYSDFEVSPLPARVTVDQVSNMKRYRRSGGAFRVGSGGPALEMKTINGNIYIRSEQR